MDILSGTLAPEFVPTHAPHLTSNYARVVELELHRGLMRTLDGSAMDVSIERFWESTRSFSPAAGHTAEMLGPEAMLVHLAIHASEHAFGRLIFPVDAAVVVRHYGLDLSWNGVAELAGAYHVAPQVYTLLRLSRQLCGAPVPDEALAALQTSRGRTNAALRPGAVLSMGSAVGSEPRLRRLLQTASPLKAIAALFRIVYQPVSAMREIYSVRSLPAVCLLYTLRPFLLVGRAARILVRSNVRGGP